MKKVCVIGAGPSGIAAVKQLKDEGHDVQCFEKGETIGGVFAPQGSAYDSCLLTISNHFMAYSDGVPIEEPLHFWTRNDYYQYLNNYVENFDLFSHIQLNTVVEKVVKQDQKWEVHIKHKKTKQVFTFDRLVVCTGAYQKPNIPHVVGIESFQGKVYHSQECKNNEPFAGRKVLCVGLGETSADLTTEIAEVAEKCVLSVRRYQQIAVRFPYGNNTIDTYTIRASNTMSQYADQKYHNKIYHNFFKRDDSALHLMAKWSLASGPLARQVITKNPRLFSAIHEGKVMTNVGGIKRFEKNSVFFNDGSEEEIDTVVWCTGFQLEFPFLPETYQFANPRDLYKHIFLPNGDNTIAFVGFTRPLQGGVPVIAEMQSRYIAQVFSKKAMLPDEQELNKIIKYDKQHDENEFCVSPHVSGLVNYSHYMEDMAQLVNCCPEVSLFKDPKLYYKLFFAPHLAIQYRISGTHALGKKAKDLIKSYSISITKKQQRKLLFYLMLGKLFPFGKYKFRMNNRFKNKSLLNLK